MGAGKVLALIAGLLTLIGTYVVAIYGIAGSYAGSGIGFILNIPDLFSNAAKESGVVLVTSLFEKRASGIYHNTAVVIEKDGSIAGKYRKMHIPDDPAY